MFTVRVNAPLWCRTCVIFHVLSLLTIFNIVFKQIVWYCWPRKPVIVSVFILPSILPWIEILTSLCDVCITPDEALVSRDADTHLAPCYDYILHYLTIIPLQFNELLHCIFGGTAAAATPPFRPGNPALCGSCPLVTPYYSRPGDLLCYSCTL